MLTEQILMFQNSWSTKLSQQPLHCTIASLPEPSIVFQGQSNQLLVFSNNQTQALPIRKQVLSLSTINSNEILLLTRYSLSCFNFLNNQQIFSIEFENAQKLYVINGKIMVVCGSSLFCYDSHGEQMYVNHVSANIACIINVEMGKECDEIVIANEDMTMSRYSKLNIVFDYAKIVGQATSLCWISKGVMVGTKEGTIAYYQTKKSKWKAKSSHSVLKILKYNLMINGDNGDNGDKSQRIIVLRQNGSIELRDWLNGGTLAKIKTGEQIVEGFITDFRKQGFDQILCVLTSGNVRAFNLIEAQGDNPIANNATKVGQQKVSAIESVNKNEEIEKLNKIRAQLEYEVSRLKAILKQSANETENQEQEIVSPNFKLVASLEYKQGLILNIKSEEGYINGLTFEQKIMPVLIDRTQHLSYKFRNGNEIAGEITCEILVNSSFSGNKYEIRKISIYLPRFWEWGLDPRTNKNIEGKLKFKMIERSARYLKWLKECFFMNISEKEEERLEGLPIMQLRFYNWYRDAEMQMIFAQKEGWVEIRCDSLETMGEIVQDLVNYVGVKNLNTYLHFPKVKQKIRELLQAVERLSQTKMSISSDMAESINNIKFLLVKGESSRQVGLMNLFRKTYSEVMEQNRSLMTEIQKKNMNTKILSDSMKQVGNFINQIANVRYGESKNLLITQCRQAIKKKNFPIIMDLMDRGVESSM